MKRIFEQSTLYSVGVQIPNCILLGDIAGEVFDFGRLCYFVTSFEVITFRWIRVIF